MCHVGGVTLKNTGPWVRSDNFIYGPGMVQIAVLNPTLGSEKVKAFGDAITALPELLAACKRIRGAIVGFGSLDVEKAILDDAIAKAEEGDPK